MLNDFFVPYSYSRFKHFREPPTSPGQQPGSFPGYNQHRNSAFESYRKPSDQQQYPAAENNNKPVGVKDDESKSSEDNHTVVATARGVYDSNGGVLESKETGKISINIDDLIISPLFLVLKKESKDYISM